LSAVARGCAFVIDLRQVLGTAAILALCQAAPGAHAVETITTGMIGAANAPGWPYYIAQSKGFLAAAGIALDVIYVPTASGLMQQLSAGSLDIVADIGVVEPIHAIDRGAAVALLRIIGAVPPYAILAKPGIGSVKDLKGKIVCIGGLRDINRVYLDRVMQANGLKDGDYDITVVGNTPARLAALQSGAVDATMLAPPMNFLAEAAGFKTIAMVIDYASDLPFGGADVSLAYAAKHREAVASLLKVIDQSVAWFYDDAHRDEAIDILAKEMKTAKRDEITKSYDYLKRLGYFARDDVVSRSRMQNLIDAMKALGDIAGTIQVDQLVIPGLTRVSE